MKLVIFDIDGTIVDSVHIDSICFIQTFADLYQIDLTNADWSQFKNVTDTGLTIDIFDQWLNRKPSDKEINIIKNHFYGLLNNRTDEFTEITGALSFINTVSKQSGLEIGFATGGWTETAHLKCDAINFDLKPYILKSSNDHFNRARIIELVIKDALNYNNIDKFESIVYFGDGVWDLKTTNELGIDFIGIDFENNKKLHRLGAQKIVNHYQPIEKVMELL